MSAGVRAEMPERLVGIGNGSLGPVPSHIVYSRDADVHIREPNWLLAPKRKVIEVRRATGETALHCELLNRAISKTDTVKITPQLD